VRFISYKLTDSVNSHLNSRELPFNTCTSIEIGLADVVKEPTKTYGDNTAAILLCEEDIVTSGNQFMATQYHYNKEVEIDGIAKALWVPTAFNLADIFTKIVLKQSLYTSAAGVMLENPVRASAKRRQNRVSYYDCK